MRFYIAVRHKGVWRVAERLYDEKAWSALLSRAEREVLEAIRDTVTKALEKLGRPAMVEEPKEKVDERGKVKGYYLLLYSRHLASFLECAAERVKAEPAEVRLEGRNIVMKVGGVKAEVEFKLLKCGEAEFLLAKDVEQTLAFYKSLKALGVPVEIMPKGVKINSKAMWALVATAVEKAIEHGGVSKWPAKVMPDVKLLKVYSIGNTRMYVFRAEDTQYYFAVKTEQGWRTTGGKYSGGKVKVAGESVPIIADAINVIYRERGVERRVEVKYDKKGVPYIKLTNVDLRLLGLTRP